MRDRWRWIGLAGLIGAFLGGATGWVYWGQQEFHAQHTLNFTASPVAGINSELNTANEDARLRVDQVLNRELDLIASLVGTHADGLSVVASRPTETTTQLQLSATGPDPAVLSQTLRSVLSEYVSQTTLHDEAEQAKAWDLAANELRQKRSHASAALARYAQAQTPSPGSDQTDLPQSESTSLEQAWSAATQALRESRVAAQESAKRLEELRRLPVPTVKEVAALDEEAAAWFGRQRGLEAQNKVTVWPPNADAAEKLREQAELDTWLQTRTQDTRIIPVGDSGGAFRAVRLSQAVAEADGWNERLALDQAVADELEPAVTRTRNLLAEIEQLDADVAAQTAALGELQRGPGVALSTTDQADWVPAESEIATAVSSDDRLQKTAMGAGLGLMLVALIPAIGFASDRRVRQAKSGELIGSSVPLLSALPVIDAAATTAQDVADPDGVSQGIGGEQVVAIQSVRAVLEGQMAEGQTSFALAGVGSGSGATSVAVGVATSMALSGSRVLLVDLAWLQKPSGQGNDAEAARDGLGVDGVIQELGYLEDEDRELLGLGEKNIEVGFGALLRGKSLRRSVIQTRLEGLVVLGAMGQAGALRREWAGRVSSRWLTRLLAVCRRGGYAAVILDAGAATGSIEGMLGCAAADGTVVVVSNDETQADYDKAVTRLRLVGAKVIGTVLNRSGARRGARARGSLARASEVGGTTGSGIFAAAVEARSGGAALRDESRSKSKSGKPSKSSPEDFGVPMPRFDEEPSTNQTKPASASSKSTKTKSAPRSIATGVDPVDEQPTKVRPTPPRKPPTPQQANTPPRSSKPLAPTAPTGSVDPTAPPPLDVHISDDVMDQLVDHAIRAARKPHTKPAPRPTPPDPQGQNAPPSAGTT